MGVIPNLLPAFSLSLNPGRYNDTWARIHDPPVPLPLPREFTVVMIDSGTMRTVMGIHWSLQGTRENDLIIFNLGHHYT